MTEDRLVKAPEAAALLGWSVKTLRRSHLIRPVMVPMPGHVRQEAPRWSLLEVYTLIQTLKQQRAS